MRTYGTAELIDGEWKIEVEPHVAMKLKRVFSRLHKQHSRVLSLKATDEVCRELEWFCVRYPLEVKPAEQLTARAARHRDDCDVFNRLVSGEAQPNTFDLAIPARDYQRVAASALLAQKGLLLADDLGVGKTLSAICALTDPRARPALVVTLTHLPRQWDAEIKRFCPRLRTHIVKKGTPYDVRIGAKRGKQTTLIEPEFPDVLIINYHKLAGWAASLSGVVKSVVFDECQELRNEESQKYDAAKQLAEACTYRLGMSATPIYNFGIEFYNVLSVLNPDAMGTRDEFLIEWCTGTADSSKATISNPRAFGAHMREAGLMLRRTRSDVQRELPTLQRVIHRCDADPAALKDATTAAAELARLILAQDTAWETRGQATRELDWRLRQATGIAKAPYVAAFVRMLVESGEKVVLYGWHRAVYELWNDALSDLKPVFFTGEESPTQKQKSRDAFIENSDARILIMSLRAGSGLDGLQHACRTVVFGELDWAWGVHLQAEGRVHRDGQPDPVAAYYLVSDEGSDPFVSQVIGLKRTQLEPAINAESDLVTVLESKSSEGIRMLAEHFISKQITEAAE